MLTKTVRSRFNHEIGDKVEGCVIVEKRVVFPPDPTERRLGVYDYVVEVPPAAMNARPARSERAAASKGPSTGGTRMTPEMHGAVIRRVSSR